MNIINLVTPESERRLANEVTRLRALAAAGHFDKYFKRIDETTTITVDPPFPEVMTGDFHRDDDAD